MPTKAIKFKNGMKLPVFNTETISYTANTPYSYTYEKAAQMIVNNSTILNSGFFNHPYEDMDGNVWTWVYNQGGVIPQIKVTRKNGTTITRGLGTLSENTYSFLYLVSSGQTGYNICVGYRRPSLYSTVSANSQLYVTYINNTNGTRTYQNDLSNVNNYPNVRLSNRVITNDTISVTGYFKRNSNGNISDLDFVFGLYAAGSIDNTNILATLSENAFVDLFEKDPYAEGGTSTTGGGGGTFDDTSDTVLIPSYDPVELLNRGYANRGFVNVYLPTQAQVLDLYNYLWSSGIDTTLKKLYADPIQSIISLSMLPLAIVGTNTGNIHIAHTDTEISAVMLADNQFVTLDCSTIDLSEFWGSYLDYSPYTKLSVYLPFIGVRALNVDDFMNGIISLKYVIDIVSGDCIAFISKTGASSNAVVSDPQIQGVLYQFNGNVSLQVPISAANFAQMYGASISAAVGGVGMLAGAVTGGLSAPMAISGIAATAVNVASSKPSILRSGAIPSSAGWLGVQKPYLILQRPRQCLPENQNTLTGYPSYITVTIGDVEGYNEFEIIHLENIPATEQEKDEIERLLKSGVIL